MLPVRRAGAGASPPGRARRGAADRRAGHHPEQDVRLGHEGRHAGARHAARRIGGCGAGRRHGVDEQCPASDPQGAPGISAR
ncbi:hypothetical protein L530_4288 [Bordetella bronchiseptica MO211]|nr:hypothetical protein L530_4288 [Bordetella bronchiseptica MO211]